MFLFISFIVILIMIAILISTFLTILRKDKEHRMLMKHDWEEHQKRMRQIREA